MYAMAKAPRTVQMMLESAVRLYQQGYRSVLPFTCVAVVASLIGNAFTFTHDLPQTPQELLRMPGYKLTLFSSTLIAVFAYGALWAKLDFIARGEPMSAVRAFAIALRALPTLAVSTVLFLIAMMVGIVLFIVPGAIVSVALSMYGPIVMLEGKGMLSSLRASHELVRGSWWYVAVAQLAGFLPALLFASLALIITEVALTTMGIGGEARIVVSLVTSGLVTAVVTPFFAALVLELYYELKLRRAVITPSA
jgi:hypothetical protein